MTMSNEKNEIKINIVGFSATGKSTIMHLIYKELFKHGFDVDIEFGKFDDFENENDFRINMIKNQSERLRTIKEKSKIILKEVRAKHSIFSNNDEKA